MRGGHPLGTWSSDWQLPSLGHITPFRRRRWEESQSRRRWRTPGKQGDASSHEPAEVDAVCTGPAVARTRSSVDSFMASSLVFMEFLSKKINVSLILIPSLGLFIFCWFILFKFDVIVFVLFYYVLFHYI